MGFSHALNTGQIIKPGANSVSGPCSRLFLANQENEMQMHDAALPCAGRIDCALCYGGATIFDRTRTSSPDGAWRITANPTGWGNPRPEVLVLGFSKGPSQARNLLQTPPEAVAFRGARAAVGKILAHVGLLPDDSPERLRAAVDRAIADRAGRFAWGSLIRCTVERRSAGGWTGTGGDMLGRFMASDFGREVAMNCSARFLRELPVETRLVLLFGLGSKQSYVAQARSLITRSRPGSWRSVNEVAYTDGRITVVHVEHFRVQGAHLSNWLGENAHPRARLGLLARDAVARALVGGRPDQGR
jgi:hypothetical protein